MGHAHADVQKQVKTYLIVFASLMVLTFVTVFISRFHLSVGKAVALALVVATIKGSLVACYFMHLMSERRFIYGTLLLTAVFFVVLIFAPVSQMKDEYNGIEHVKPRVEAASHGSAGGHE